MFPLWLIGVYLLATGFFGLFLVRLHNSNDLRRESLLLANAGAWALVGVMEVYVFLGHMPQLRWPYAVVLLLSFVCLVRLSHQT